MLSIVTLRKVLILCLLLLMLLGVSTAEAQLPTPIGTNHPELDWKEIETEHFRLIYHEELSPVMQEAAKAAEEAYRVVTTNLGTQLPSKTKMYFSDNDAIKNAFAFADDHIFIWMRGILDDHPYAVRSSGTSKWLRSVITHELTHTVIAYATRGRWSWLLPVPMVPRWFNEGMARYMEPDGWTEDLDLVLRNAAITGELELSSPGLWEGALVYEGGQSVVRHIAATYGDTSLRKIITYGQEHSYDFAKAVEHGTGKTLNDLLLEWKKRVNVYYNTQYGLKRPIDEFGKRFKDGLDIVGAARMSPDGRKYAVIGRTSLDEPTLLYIYEDDTSGKRKYIELDAGVEGSLSWSPDNRYLLLSKLRFGAKGSLVYDLYELDIETHDMRRLTTDGRFEDADLSPDGKQIVAVKHTLSGSDLWLLDRTGQTLRQLTTFNNPNTSVYWPRWSPKSNVVAFSVFDAQGRRDIGVIDVASNETTYLQRDSVNDRYPVWSPDASKLAFISFRNGVPNVFVHTFADRTAKAVTDVAGGLTVWAWSQAKDSLLVTSVDDRRHIRLYWIAATPIADTAGHSRAPQLSDRYTEWRDVTWPLVPRPASELAAVTTSSPENYNAFGAIKHAITLPMLSTDKSETGELGLRYGLITAWSDPMAKHNFFGFADFGDESKQLGGAIAYTNNTLRPSIRLTAGSLLKYSGMIDHIAYMQRDDHAGLALVHVQPTPNSLENFWLVALGAEYRKVDPWNAVQFVNTPLDRRPINAEVSTLGAKLGYASPDLMTSLTYSHADGAYLSYLTFSRYRFGMSYRMPFSPSRHAFFALHGRAIAQFGDEFPQEFVGFTPYDIFGGGVNPIQLDPYVFQAPYRFETQERVRGVREYRYGDRLAIASAELRIPDGLFQNLFTPLRAFSPQFTLFFDIGSAWYAKKPMNNESVTITELAKTSWKKGAGLELRSEFAPGSALTGGVAWELVEHARPDWYVRAILEW